MKRVGQDLAEGITVNGVGLVERNTMFGQVDATLFRIPIELRHRGTVDIGAYPELIGRWRRRYVPPPVIKAKAGSRDELVELSTFPVIP